eukprot:1157905-Pelagomonas_calceolata.AAC.1
MGCVLRHSPWHALVDELALLLLQLLAHAQGFLHVPPQGLGARSTFIACCEHGLSRNTSRCDKERGLLRCTLMRTHQGAHEAHQGAQLIKEHVHYMFSPRSTSRCIKECSSLSTCVACCECRSSRSTLMCIKECSSSRSTIMACGECRSSRSTLTCIKECISSRSTLMACGEACVSYMIQKESGTGMARGEVLRQEAAPGHAEQQLGSQPYLLVLCVLPHILEDLLHLIVRELVLPFQLAVVKAPD